MKKTLLSLALLAATGTAYASDLGNARLAGLSGAGYATGSYADGVLYNPSLGASFKEGDRFAVVGSVGAFISADVELLDDLDELTDFLDELDAITSYQDLTPDLAQRAISHLENIEDQYVLLDVGTSLVVAIPNNLVSVSFIHRSRLSADVYTVVDEEDYLRIENAINDYFDPDDLSSSIFARGAVISDLGVALSKSFSLGEGQLLVGATPKRVTVETFAYNSTLREFEEDDFDAADYTVKSSSTNLDAGVTYMAGSMRYALAVNNALSREYETVDGGVMETEPRITAALGYQTNRVSLEGALDLAASPDLATGADRRSLRAGVEFSPLSWMHLRAGLQKDLENNFSDTISVGLGFSPGVFNIDLAAISGDDDSAGAALQIGLRF
ncbi:conjugal transfer protein TraF [Marinimicrobium sp. ABcell2]|uniref:conjugal transfer protein TraF n=1 Tax=Marinimicrobium sp. ABcell2 TaxID=3069751 RepID=UPI0027B2BE91|nr:conjugal transfer protein TraF [Marinimicrobium sp. ABcell2]MDQ2077999.1 conjugal transfer protein TraF [Marinimicrobium sp. ABcell2]